MEMKIFGGKNVPYIIIILITQRCCDGNTDDYVECYREYCPQDSCDKTCFAIYNDDASTCVSLAENGLIGPIEYRICLAKAAVIKKNLVIF